jgi:sporulation protein YlmC with PRC-barrel domain
MTSVSITRNERGTSTQQEQAMLWNASKVNGYAISASNGRLGTVSDFLFDDASWSIRWLVVDTGKWLSGRKVLLPASALGHFDLSGHEITVKLTIEQVKDSPDIDTDRPVSRQMESSMFGYYGSSPYWSAGLGMGGYGMGMIGLGYAGGAMGATPALGSGYRRREEELAEIRHRDDDPNLRSIDAVTGYHIHATDGEIGHVEDFLVGDDDWRIHYLVVDTKNWWPGKKVLISPQSAIEINWVDRLVNLSFNRQKVKDSPAYDASITVDHAYDETFLTYYGIRWVAGAQPAPRAGRP